ncbi:hypothetical protein H9Q09_16245 [Aurantimonas sp. DM33-3]|uniref:hypothetical protein n=1 Tax=Aurantimonas sp. DM33-3 TaxID=2766955 RepID=UPI0016524418|nr:hypothetical protein [Aurantimonas sp. DM33-3]MBC6717746.1 hypothetical protein [Aurantimonas sp. DM33-3]
MALHHEAGQMAAPDYANTQIYLFLLRGVHRRHSESPRSEMPHIVDGAHFIASALPKRHAAEVVD